jgi:hypothetical protein
MDGFLKIEYFKLGDYLSISGVQPGTDLTVNFQFGLDGNHCNGDGKIALFGLDIAQASFDMNGSHVHVGKSFVLRQ